jgi:hypothetical protein
MFRMMALGRLIRSLGRPAELRGSMSRISTPPLAESGRKDIDFRDSNAHSSLLLVEAEGETSDTRNKKQWRSYKISLSPDSGERELFLFLKR